MGGGDTLPGFPQANPTESYWQTPPHKLAHHRTTPSLPVDTLWDYIIIGSGISGAATAYKLLSRDPNASILMLESRTAASGASGRNGGHCRAGFWVNFRKYVEEFGEEEALRFERFEEENVEDMRGFVREEGVECGFRDVRTVDGYVGRREWKRVLDVLKFREEVRKRRPDAVSSIERTLLHGEEARKKLGMPHLVGAVTWPAHTQNPYLLVCRMLELGLEKGLNLQTNTTAFEVSESHSTTNEAARWIVKTDRGNVKAKNVVLATNAYTNALHPGLAKTGFLTPGRSQVAAIRPGSKMSPDYPALKGTSAGLNDLNGSGDYYHARAPGLAGEGDILYGGGRSISKTKELGITDDSRINPEIATYLHSAPGEFFGKGIWGENSAVVRDWSGITCYTPDTFPLVGEAPGQKGLWMSVGMNGHGMAMAFRSAEALVHMMVEGREPEWFPKVFKVGRAWEGEGEGRGGG